MTASAHNGTGPANGADPNQRPKGLAVLAANIPDELKALCHWVVWRYTWKPPKGKAAGKWDKPPINPRTGKLASSTDPATWSTFTQAMTAYATGHYDRVGFVVHKHDEMTEDGELLPLMKKNPETGETVPVGCGCDQTDGLVVLDTDKCRDPETGEMEAWAKEIFAEVNSYAEASPSATGGRGVARGRKPAGRCKKGGFEAYETGRYVTITGHRLPDAPVNIEERQEAIGRVHARMFAEEPKKDGQKRGTRAEEAGSTASGSISFADDEVVTILDRAKNGPKFRALMAGDVSGHGDDESAADAALCSIIAFVTKDAAQIERIFNRSKLAERDKWDRPDYRSRTIAFSLSRTTEQYEPRGPEIKFTRGTSASTNGKASANGQANPPPKAGHRLGNLTLHPGAARRTAGGSVRVQVVALKGVAVVYDFVLTASPAGWRQHAAMLEQLGENTPDRAVVLKTFAEIIAEAGRRADAPPPPEGPTIESIVRALAAPRWQLTARTTRGAWSEGRGCEVSRGDFIACVDDELMTSCATAADAPKDVTGRVSRADLLRLIQAELQVQWATLMRSLPLMADAEMSKGSAAGRAFHEAMVRLWTSATTWEIPKKSDGQESERIAATKASLISRVKSQFRQWERVYRVPAPREKWREIHPAASAWWRVREVEGETIIHLAMRWDIVSTMRQELPGVSDQPSLLRLGRQFGVFSVTGAVPDVMDRGAIRLAVLADDFAEELMAGPDGESTSDDTDSGCDEAS